MLEKLIGTAIAVIVSSLKGIIDPIGMQPEHYKEKPMDPIKELRTEHEAVRSALVILSTIRQQIETTGSIPHPGHLTQLFDFFTLFVDRCHHAKEEELLFPAMEAVGVSRQGGPIGVMLNEHQRGREHVSGMKNALDQTIGGNTGAALELAAHARAYIDLLRRHIDKENGVLFPMAARHLSAEKLMELQAGFDRIETGRIGVGKHEAFHRMLQDLEGAYSQVA